MKLLGHAVWLGRGLPINVLSFPAIVTCLWSLWFLDHQAKRETQVQKDKPRKQVSPATETNPQKRISHPEPMTDARLVASFCSSITNRVWPQTAASHRDFNSSNIAFYRQLQRVINDVTRLNTRAREFRCLRNPSCPHLKGTFVPVYQQTHKAVVIHGRDRSLFDVCKCNEQNPACEWSNTRYVSFCLKELGDLIVFHNNGYELSSTWLINVFSHSSHNEMCYYRLII